MSVPPPRTNRLLVLLLLLLFVPLALRLAPIEHGSPRNYIPDTHVVRSALGMAQDKTLVPEVGLYSSYPNLLPYALLPVYVGRYYAGRVGGEWSGQGEFKREVALHPETVHIPARILIALLSCLAPFAVFGAMRRVGYGAGAWAAGWLCGTSLLFLQFSLQERPWAVLVSCLALSVSYAARHVQDGDLRSLLYSGLAAAGAFASHQAGLPFLLVPGLAWCFGPVPWSGRDLLARLENGVFCVALFGAAALLVGHPYLLLHGVTPDAMVSGAEVAEGGVVGGVSVGGQGFLFGFRFESFVRLSLALLGYEPVLLLLGLCGLGLAAKERALWPALGFLAFWAPIFLFNPNDHVRYLLPVALLLVYPAGAMVERLWASGSRGRVLAALLCALPLVQAGRLVWVLRADDSRALAEMELARVLEPGDVVAIDRYGPIVDLSAAALTRLESWRELRMREGTRASLLADEPPEVLAEHGVLPGLDVFYLEELISVDDRQLLVHPNKFLELQDPLPEGELLALLREQGATHVLSVSRGPERWNPLALELEAAGASALLEFDPAPGDASAERMLPLELDFALTGLWRVERAGPSMQLFEL